MSQIISYKCDFCYAVIDTTATHVYQWGEEQHICHNCFTERIQSPMRFVEQIKIPVRGYFSSHGRLEFAIDPKTGFIAPCNNHRILPVDEFKELVDACWSFYDNNNEWSRIHLLLHYRSLNSATTKQPGFVYLARGTKGLYANCYKIGKSTNPKVRIGKFNVQYQTSAELIHSIETPASYELETYFHNKFTNKRVNLEWFNLESADVDYICSIVK